ncbi:Indolepyruvate oxidoreductase subunit IorA [Dissulfuribacter thermophilus]|uniref:Indolepyruvate oxidoreductase subunit IorA n=1 Tax=Dissulfuribacter thermophilus TaxID=1156395 RepID=A0A1B9F357_9BACT|nr:indolepyruvate ferredoxin oxidoreductase subunit alpha [Dissulfuribacter thermophilus]OCC14367.1 Indolepyruvate oxidoreductase subunit IorA [Dissulfuribacter thermophilus]
MHPLLQDNPGHKMLLLGNEAIVRGAIEAGLKVGSTYPGTPSSEIGNNLFLASQDENAGFYFEFSTNEKVAMEVAASASAAGLRSLVCMKHVGLNVASDALMTLSYIATKGGMVIVTADDPSMHSSQNEQDNRIFAKFANLPMLEPRSPQEAKDMTIEAFELSERLELPVILRTTTRTAHVRGPVTFGELSKDTASIGKFEKDPRRWVPVPAVARVRHKVLLERMDIASSLCEESRFNHVIGNGKLGIVSSGVASNYVADCIMELGLEDKVRFLNLGFTFPHPRKTIINFLNSVEKVLVVEELEPFIEDAIKCIMVEEGIQKEIFGKASSHFSRCYEFDPKMVKKAILDVLELDEPDQKTLPDLSWVPELPMRPPSLCKGCPHRETYNAVKEALKAIGKEEITIYPTDIGCYTLGLLPPINMADYLICMGSSVGSSCGFSVATEQKIVSFIGDSTFFHSGISPLVNAVHNGHKFCLVILDNSTTAMTGHQPNPGIQLKPQGFDNPTVPIEDVVRGCGVKTVKKINPYKKNEAVEILKEVLQKDELSVVISESPVCLVFKKS